MISIRKYLYLKSSPGAGPEVQAERAFQSSLVQLASVTLSEIAAECGPAAGFQERLEAAESAADIDALRTEVPRTLEEYRVQKRELERRQTVEVQKMVEMLQQTIETLTRGNERSVSRLRTIEADVRAASQISEIVALKEKLRSCVEQIRESARAEQQEFATAKARLQQDFLLVQENMALARGGVPGRAEAERRIAEMAPGAILVIISLERQPAIKARYGAPASERYFAAFVDEILTRLPSPKKIFRWSERSLLVEVTEVAFSEAVELDVRRRLADLPPNVQVDVGGRHAMLDNLHRWLIVARGAGPEETVARIDGFISL